MKALFITKEFFTQFTNIDSVDDIISIPSFYPHKYVARLHDNQPEKNELICKDFKYSGHCYVDCIEDNLVIYSQV